MAAGLLTHRILITTITIVLQFVIKKKTLHTKKGGKWFQSPEKLNNNNNNKIKMIAELWTKKKKKQTNCMISTGTSRTENRDSPGIVLAHRISLKWAAGINSVHFSDLILSLSSFQLLKSCKHSLPHSLLIGGVVPDSVLLVPLLRKWARGTQS